jgi:microcystin-dependent protein
MTASAPSPWAAPNYSSLTGSDAIALQQTFQSLSNYLEKINNSVTIANTAATASATAATTPTGTVVAFAGSAAPTGWLLCFGQTVSRVTYATLFTILGTQYGSGDGSTTFVLPDMRGRVAAGRDNMGGTAASRLTNAASSIQGDLLGAGGGNENLHNHNHAQTNHTHTQSNHSHDNSLIGTTTFAASGHTHTAGGILASVGATNGDINRIGYVAGGVLSGASTYSLRSTVGQTLSGQGFNHNSPCYGTSDGNNANASIGLSNGSNISASSTGGAPANLTAAGSGSSQNVQPTIILNYIIKV